MQVCSCRASTLPSVGKLEAFQAKYLTYPATKALSKAYRCWPRRSTRRHSHARAMAGEAGYPVVSGFRSVPPGPSNVSVAIIGAGFSGLGMGIKLKQAGVTSFTIFEASDDIGGTWRDNTYPGCACDIPSPLYSYSFAKYPYWSELFSGQPEIWKYQKWVVDKYALKPYIKLNTRIATASFDNSAGVWHLTSVAGDKYEANVVVMGVGTSRF